jgi:hypothetical protein
VEEKDRGEVKLVTLSLPVWASREEDGGYSGGNGLPNDALIYSWACSAWTAIDALFLRGPAQLLKFHPTVQNKMINRSNGSNNRGDASQPQRRECGSLVSLI